MLSLFKNRWRSLIFFIGLIVLVQALGAVTTFSNVTTWYATLEKPPWTPPNGVFGPVWTMLYIMLAFFGWRLWTGFTGSWQQTLRQPALRYYFIQLFFNALWSPLFFGLHWLVPAFVDILLIITFTGLTFRHAYRIDPALAWWLAPYLLWLGYAASLNGAILLLN